VNADPQYLSDRLAIRDLVEGYAFRVDSDDPGSASALFTPDGELRIFERGRADPVRERTGREAIAAAMAGLDRYDTTLHVVGNHRVDIDGDAAEGETYCLAHHVRGVEGPDGETAPYDYVMHIRYLDRFARTDEGWRIARRHLQVEFTEDRPIGTA
jgi:hypothetical protein